MRSTRIPARVATVAAVAARAALGLLWLNEGVTKYRAGFGGADILLVVQSADGNSRVPAFFTVFADSVLAHLSGVFGVVMPLLETGLGVLLVLGMLTAPAALVSALTLSLYWSADQLIAQYPVMAALSAVVVAWPAAAARFSVTALAARRMRPGTWVATALSGPGRRWR